MLWNFEEAPNESEPFGNGNTSSAGSTESDPLSHLLSSMAPRSHEINFVLGTSDVTLPGLISQQLTKDQNVKCTICSESYREPKVLACFHSFCKSCLENEMDTSNGNIICPQCGAKTQISAQLGIDGLLSDYGLENAVNALKCAAANMCIEEKNEACESDETIKLPVEGDNIEASNVDTTCTGCKSGENATAYCVDCSHYLCTNCSMAHRFMNIFEGHQVEAYDTSLNVTKKPRTIRTNDCKCLEHRSQPLCFFCISCNLAVCRDCTVAEHCPPVHQIEPIDNVAEKQIKSMESLMNEARAKQSELHELFRQLDAGQNRLNLSFQQAKNAIDETTNCLIQLVQEAQKSLCKELENVFGCKQLQLTIIDKEIQKVTKKMSQTIEFTQRLLKYSSPTEVMVFKPLLDSRLQGFLSFNADVNNFLQNSSEIIEVQPVNFLQARQAIFSVMNSLKSVESWQTQGSFIRRIQSPDQSLHLASISRFGSHHISPPLLDSGFVSDLNLPQCKNELDIGYNQPNNLLGNSVQSSSYLSSAINIQQNSIGSSSGGIPIGSAPASGNLHSSLGTSPSNNIFGQYEKWTNNTIGGLSLNDEITDLSVLVGPDKISTSSNGNIGLYPPRSQIKRHKMTYHCKFGEFGVMEGQFTEPSGVAVNAQNDIVVADTNNHRIQVFDKEGRFKFQFGECGKRDGQLLYPNRVSVNRVTGDFVVTERSPTHQIQIYNQYGQFLRKFGANILQHPRGVCVDHQGRIIVVECKVMRVLIFDAYGNIIQKFSCSRYLEFPNGVCSTDKNEILISDNRAHCIKVFSYDGQYLRQIGGEGVTNYPIGVGINSLGEVVVADNHNNFNLTIFSQDGTLLNALESKVKHAQCFDAALIEDGSVVLASKDYRLYIYRYQQI